jgi:uncharacterized protein with GYD domain
MPVGFFRLKTASPFEGDPRGLLEFVRNVVESTGARFVELYFDVGRESAVAIVEDLDDYLDVKAVASLLEAQGFEKYVKIEQVEEAFARRDRFRPKAS